MLAATRTKTLRVRTNDQLLFRRRDFGLCRHNDCGKRGSFLSPRQFFPPRSSVKRLGIRRPSRPRPRRSWPTTVVRLEATNRSADQIHRRTRNRDASCWIARRKSSSSYSDELPEGDSRFFASQVCHPHRTPKTARPRRLRPTGNLRHIDTAAPLSSRVLKIPDSSASHHPHEGTEPANSSTLFFENSIRH